MSSDRPCPACGTSLDPSATTCTVCGFRLPDMHQGNLGGSKCARCGTALEAGFEFCPACGLDQRKAAPRPPTGALRVREGPGGPKLEFAPLTPSPTSASPAAVGATASASPGARYVAPAGASAASGPAAAPSPSVPSGPAAPMASHVPAAVAQPQSRPPRASACLVAIDREGHEGLRHPLPPEGLVIGRHQGDLLFADDPFLSAVHARLEPLGNGRYMLVDASSRNGVYLRITRAEPVYPGDMFLVGHHLLRLENIETPERERPPGSDGTRIFGTPLDPPWARLVVLGRGGLSGDIHYLRTAEVELGRELGDIHFPSDRYMSRRHVRISLHSDGTRMSVYLEDLGSANGTYLRLRGRAEVGPNDTFRVGDQILRIKVEA